MAGNGIIGICATIFSSPVKGITLSHNSEVFLLLHGVGLIGYGCVLEWHDKGKCLAISIPWHATTLRHCVSCVVGIRTLVREWAGVYVCKKRNVALCRDSVYYTWLEVRGAGICAYVWTLQRT